VIETGTTKIESVTGSEIIPQTNMRVTQSITVIMIDMMIKTAIARENGGHPHMTDEKEQDANSLRTTLKWQPPYSVNM